MDRLLNKNIINFNSTRLISLTENFLQNRIEHYASLCTLNYLSFNNNHIISEVKCLVRQELNQYLIKLFKSNLHIFTIEDNSTLLSLAEQISLKYEPLIKEKLEENIICVQKFLNQSKIVEALL